MQVIIREKKRWPLFKYFWPMVITVVLIGLGLLPLNAVGNDTEKVVKENACSECHDEISVAFNGSLHGSEKVDCVACHGDAAKHLESGEAGTIFAFKAEDTGLQKSKQCLNCHKDTTAWYLSSAHAKASMDCTQCHSIHKESYSMSMLKTKKCASCHQEVVAQFMLNERHRLIEGVMDCTTCHDVHGPALRERLGGFKHEACLKCHNDKGGPFIYEHEASSIEGCVACHEVHGSTNRHMLHHQSVGDLCFSCHMSAPSWHSRFATSETNCANCHSTIHGSNLSDIFLK